MDFFLRLFKRFETIGILHSVRKITGNNRKNKLFVFAVVKSSHDLTNSIQRFTE